MKKLTILERVLKIIRIPRTEYNPEIEKLDQIIAEWDGQYLQHLIDAIFDGFEIDLSNRKKLNANIMRWIDQDMYDYLRIKVGQSYINEFGDTLTKEKGFSVNIRAEIRNIDAPGSVNTCLFEELRDAKAWIDHRRIDHNRITSPTTWKLKSKE